ncbi:hypothetical protein K377_03469 [Streptomyces sp. PsTaAH-137]|nr:hypothetical protein K377_03469 [Streptomyces sp. PsTaAH-137]
MNWVDATRRDWTRSAAIPLARILRRVHRVPTHDDHHGNADEDRDLPSSVGCPPEVRAHPRAIRASVRSDPKHARTPLSRSSPTCPAWPWRRRTQVEPTCSSLSSTPSVLYEHQRLCGRPASQGLMDSAPRERRARSDVMERFAAWWDVYECARARFRIQSPNATPHIRPQPTPDHNPCGQDQSTARCIAVPHSRPATNQTKITRAHVMPARLPVIRILTTAQDSHIAPVSGRCRVVAALEPRLPYSAKRYRPPTRAPQGQPTTCMNWCAKALVSMSFALWPDRIRKKGGPIRSAVAC